MACCQMNNVIIIKPVLGYSLVSDGGLNLGPTGTPNPKDSISCYSSFQKFFSVFTELDRVKEGPGPQGTGSKTRRDSSATGWRRSLHLWAVRSGVFGSLGAPWTVAHQAPPSLGFSREEYWSGWPFPSPGDLPDPGSEPNSPALADRSSTTATPGSPGFHRSEQFTSKQVLCKVLSNGMGSSPFSQVHYSSVSLPCPASVLRICACYSIPGLQRAFRNNMSWSLLSHRTLLFM